MRFKIAEFFYLQKYVSGKVPAADSFTLSFTVFLFSPHSYTSGWETNTFPPRNLEKDTTFIGGEGIFEIWFFHKVSTQLQVFSKTYSDIRSLYKWQITKTSWVNSDSTFLKVDFLYFVWFYISKLAVKVIHKIESEFWKPWQLALLIFDPKHYSLFVNQKCHLAEFQHSFYTKKVKT